MKKVNISNLFHWLYGLIMLLPFILFFGGMLTRIMSNGVLTGQQVWSDFGTLIMNNFSDYMDGGVLETLNDIYGYLVYGVFGLGDGIGDILITLMSYWTGISLIWLVFDVVMYVPNLVHRWMDKGAIK